MNITRKSFMIGAGATLASTALFGASKRTFRIGLVGCGGRGTGAWFNLAKGAEWLGCDAKLVACADFFADKAAELAKQTGAKAFGGANGYKEVLKSDCEIVILATPPFFRPRMTMAALKAGKQVFAEKPVATDPRGIREFLEATAYAEEQKLNLWSGTCYRHNRALLSQIGAMRKGAIGRLTGGRIFRLEGEGWIRPRRPTDTNAGYLCNNWYHFWEMGGDQVTEQTIHQTDVANWFIGRTPVSAIGIGARLRRPAGIGNIFDSHDIDFDYGEGLHVNVMNRQINGCANQTGGELYGTEGKFGFCWGDTSESEKDGFFRFDGKKVAVDESFLKRHENHMIMEHYDFLEGYLAGKVRNDGREVGMSTAAGIMGTLATYSGAEVKMDDILRNTGSKFYNGWNAGFTAADFETTEAIPVPKEGVAPVPGTEAV